MRVWTLMILVVTTACLTDAGGRHTNNWAVLVGTSRFWFNYRHMANALSIYHTVKRLGIPDSQIILMLADDVACNPRNSYAGAVFNNVNHKLNLYGDTVQVDYRGYEVTVESFMRLLTGRHHPDTPRSKQLLTDESSNILVYLTGHGGDEFLKFQDAEEISSQEIADAFETMHKQRRYNEILFMVDTCQANTLFTRFYSPNIVAVGSSKKGENSYSHHSDWELGVAVIDRFTYFLLEFMENVRTDTGATLGQLSSKLDFKRVGSTVGWRTDLFGRNVEETLITDFFGSVARMDISEAPYPLNVTKTVEREARRSDRGEVEAQEVGSITVNSAAPWATFGLTVFVVVIGGAIERLYRPK